MLHISFGLTAYILCITFFLGCCLGSFADCLAMRLLSGESAFAGRSHCDSCGHVLGAPDLVPLFSSLLRRKGSGRVLFHRAACGNRLLHGSLSF